MDLPNWELQIGGRVKQELRLNWDTLNSLPQRMVFATMECAGNGRSFLFGQAEGVQWGPGAVGHAEWRGVPLQAVLERAGLRPDALEIVVEGADQGTEPDHPDPMHFARSLPLEKALSPDTILATMMNGEPLEPNHGCPVRLIVPGWYGVASVKWTTRIDVISQRFHGYFQSVKYTIKNRDGRGTHTEIVGPVPPKSEIIQPHQDEELGTGRNRVFGLTWAGEEQVAAVEVSTDGGQSWNQANVIGPNLPYSWSLWEYSWEVDKSGSYSLLSRAMAESGQVQPMRHDPLNGGYLINFSRPTKVRVDASRSTDDVTGDPQTLLQAMDTLAEERAALQMDIDMKWMGSGI